MGCRNTEAGRAGDNCLTLDIERQVEAHKARFIASAGACADTIGTVAELLHDRLSVLDLILVLEYAASAERDLNSAVVCARHLRDLMQPIIEELAQEAADEYECRLLEDSK